MSSLKGIEATTKSFLESIHKQGGPQIHKLSVEDARGILSETQKEMPQIPVDIEDRTIPVGPTGKVNLRVIRPKGAKGALPVVIYFHGGGWVLGDANTHDRLVREIAHGSGAAVVFVDYSRAPESRYPTAIEEAYAATKFVVQNAKSFTLDTSRVVVAGDSVGGNMATVVAMLARERGGPAIGLQVLFYPVTDANFDWPSYQQFASGFYLTRESMRWFWNQYLPELSTRKEATASPLQASWEQLHGSPPALILTAEFDVLRDEGEEYARKLTDAGVPVAAVRCMGTIHDFVMLNPLSNTPAARMAISLATEQIRNFNEKVQQRKPAVA